jgi:1-acyl-sn-glycerol-3-phosphate acyltransferase
VSGQQADGPEAAPEGIVVRTLLSIWTWGVLSVACILGFFVAVPLAAVTLPFDQRRTIIGRFVHRIAVLVVTVNPLWTFRVHGPLGRYRPRRTVVVCNHVSNTDAFLIAHLPWEVKWLSKSSLFLIPFVGWLMWLAGDVPVVRGTRDSVARAMARCRVLLERGAPVVIFPEGTRSETGALLPFKDGAFRLAIEARAEVLPMAVAGTRTALEKHSWRVGRALGLLAVGEPIDTAGMSSADIGALRDLARNRIEGLRRDLESTLAAARAPTRGGAGS